jgi:hypothetical protein
MQKPQQEHLILFATQHHWLHAYIYNSGTCQLTQTHCARFGDGADNKHDWVLIEISYQIHDPTKEFFLSQAEFFVVTREGKIQQWKLDKESHEVLFLRELKCPPESVKNEHVDCTTLLDEVVLGTSQSWSLYELEKSLQIAKHHGGDVVQCNALRKQARAKQLDADCVLPRSISRIACAPDTSLLGVVTGACIHLIEMATLEIFHSWRCDSDITDVDYSPTFYQMACCYDGGFVVVDLTSLNFLVKRVQSGRHYQSLAFSIDGKMLFLGWQDNIDVFDLTDMDNWLDLVDLCIVDKKTYYS